MARSFRANMPDELRVAMRGHPLLGRRVGYKFHREQDSKYIYSGSVKIGSLEEYRSHEKATIRDASEGVEAIGFPIEGEKLSDWHPSSIANTFFRPSPGADPSSIQISGMIFISDVYNFYVYCFSYENSFEVMDSFKDETPYDSVAVIEDLFEFANSIATFHPLLKGSQFLCLPVVYRDNPRSGRDPRAHPLETVFEKAATFSANKEGRIVFLRPAGAKLDPWAHPTVRKLVKPGQVPTRPLNVPRTPIDKQQTGG